MKQCYKRQVVVIAAAFLAFTLMLMSCETEKVVTETVEVLVRDTVAVSIISVDSIFVAADSVTEGASVELTASVSFNGDTGPLNYSWFTTDGVFIGESENDTVTWKAPDEAGAYMVSVHITDGDNIGIGSRFIGVGMYVPSASPFFLGDVNCMTCHGDQHVAWEETGHAEAWASLEAAGVRSFCIRCHTVGYDGPPGNGGYDETPISRYENVQCESCHGPASEHVADLDPSKVSIDYGALQCATCHQGTHHPYFDEWENSPHNFDSTFFATGNAACQGCHEGVAASIRLSGDLSQFYGAGPILGRPSAEEQPHRPVTCQTCHDPHDGENPGQLRTVADVPLVTANGESPVITVGGSGKLCMHCHHARRGPDDQVINGYAHFGPHANPQADMMLGASAYHAVAEEDFVWAGPSHLNVQNSCKTCHLNTSEYQGPNAPAVTGHSFQPTVAACAGCHGPINDFDEIMALEDFDGDGSVEGVQSEVQGLMAVLEDELWASFVGRGLDTTGLDLEDILGSDSLSTLLERESGYNWAFVHDDKSHGIHNPDYAVQLLQQSIMHLTGSLPQGAVVLSSRSDDVVAGKF